MSSNETVVKKIPQERAKPRGTTTKIVNQVIEKNNKKTPKTACIDYRTPFSQNGDYQWPLWGHLRL